MQWLVISYSVSSSVSGQNQATSNNYLVSSGAPYRGVKDDAPASNNNDFGVTCTVSGTGFQSTKPSSKTAALLTASSYTTHSPDGANYSVPSTLNAPPVSTVYYGVSSDNGANSNNKYASTGGGGGWGGNDVIVTTTSTSPSRSPPARYNLRSTQVGFSVIYEIESLFSSTAPPQHRILLTVSHCTLSRKLSRKVGLLKSLFFWIFGLWNVRKNRLRKFHMLIC